MASIYVHIPFCSRKCLYCDFYSVGDRTASWSRYVDALIAELNSRRSEPGMLSVSPSTIYIGGGTPSLVPPDEFGRLAHSLLDFAPDCKEFTIEVNPDDVTPSLAAAWSEAGVDRVSMGVQSLVDSELRFVGRRHDAATALNAFHILRNHFANISLDLMFGLPGQSLDSLVFSVDKIIALAPEHVSVYSLMYEERTAITRLRDAGKIEEIPENSGVDMFRLVSDSLRNAGYEQYEISNYSRPGYRAIHNSRYWAGSPYVGIGPAAHSYDGYRIRSANIPDVNRYQEYWTGDRTEVPPNQQEVLIDNELREEMIMTRLRTREGLSLDEFAARFGTSSLDRLLRNAQSSIAAGNLILTDYRDDKNAGTHRLVLSKKGIMLSDEIFVSLF